jgi:hypothetical protein
MTATKVSIDQFHKFAREKLDASDAEISWDELLIAWQSACERDATNAAIREALDDVQAGRYQPVDEAMRELRSDFGFDE